MAIPEDTGISVSIETQWFLYGTIYMKYFLAPYIFHHSSAALQQDIYLRSGNLQLIEVLVTNLVLP